MPHFSRKNEAYMHVSATKIIQMRRDIDHNPQDRKNKKEKGKKDKTPLVVITHTASMIKGGGYLGARLLRCQHQAIPHHANN
jgi:hypothetical protein